MREMGPQIFFRVRYSKNVENLLISSILKILNIKIIHKSFILY